VRLLGDRNQRPAAIRLVERSKGDDEVMRAVTARAEEVSGGVDRRLGQDPCRRQVAAGENLERDLLRQDILVAAAGIVRVWRRRDSGRGRQYPGIQDFPDLEIVPYQQRTAGIFAAGITVLPWTEIEVLDPIEEVELLDPGCVRGQSRVAAHVKTEVSGVTGFQTAPGFAPDFSTIVNVKATSAPQSLRKSV
jgi:hypothetical protein